MTTYAQNKEDIIISDYFGNRTGTLLSIGENDGVTLSNSRLLILHGWKAHLVEPMREAFDKLKELYNDNKLVTTYNCAIGDKDGSVTLYANGEHLKRGDVGLLSTVDLNETKRWGNTETFTPETVEMRKYSSLFPDNKFDFISIDAEGMDVQILYDISTGLKDVSCLCIEWNSKDLIKRSIDIACEPWGLKLIHQNAENLIYAK